MHQILAATCRSAAGASRSVAKPVDLTMMSPAQRHREFIADLAPERATLHEAQVMCVRWQTAANQTRLLGNRFDVVPIANSPRLRSRQCSLVDPHGLQRLLCRTWVDPVRSRWLGKHICGMGGKPCQSRFEGFLAALSLCRRHTVLGAQVSVCPTRRVITRVCRFRREADRVCPPILLD